MLSRKCSWVGRTVHWRQLLQMRGIMPNWLQVKNVYENLYKNMKYWLKQKICLKGKNKRQRTDWWPMAHYSREWYTVIARASQATSGLRQWSSWIFVDLVGGVSNPLPFLGWPPNSSVWNPTDAKRPTTGFQHHLLSHPQLFDGFPLPRS